MNVPRRHFLLNELAKTCLEYDPKGRVLHSGHTSNYFVDVPRIFGKPPCAVALMEQMTNLLLFHEGRDIDAFISPDTGGTLLAVALQQYLAMKKGEFIPVCPYSKSGKIEGFPVSRGQGNYIIIDDVISTGSTILPLIDMVIKSSRKVIQVVTSVHRPEFNREAQVGLDKLSIPLASVFTMDEILAVREK